MARPPPFLAASIIIIVALLVVRMLLLVTAVGVMEHADSYSSYSSTITSRIGGPRSILHPRPATRELLGSINNSNSVDDANSSDNKWLVQPAIVDGTTASKSAYPFYVKSLDNTTLCGGSLIHPDVVLTAAHCQGAFDLGVLVGNYQGDSGEVRQVVQQYRNLGYRYLPGYIGNDTLLLFLDQPISNIRPVTLNHNHSIPVPGEPLTAIGRGLTSNDGTISDTLLDAQLFYIPNESCAKLLAPFTNVIVKDDILCAGIPQGNQSICEGDSGSPLLTAGGIQVGLVSFTIQCGSTVYPNGFARVSTFYSWIHTTICRYSQTPPTDCATTGTPAPGVGAIQVVVQIQHDNSPSETTFVIRRNATQQIVYAGPVYVPQPFELANSTVWLYPGRYDLEMRDSYGDGLTGFLFTGYYDVFAIVDGIDVVLLNRQEGNYQFLRVSAFEVPDPKQMISSTVSPITTAPSVHPSTVHPSATPSVTPSTVRPSHSPTRQPVPSWSSNLTSSSLQPPPASMSSSSAGPNSSTAASIPGGGATGIDPSNSGGTSDAACRRQVAPATFIIIVVVLLLPLASALHVL